MRGRRAKRAEAGVGIILASPIFWSKLMVKNLGPRVVRISEVMYGPEAASARCRLAGMGFAALLLLLTLPPTQSTPSIALLRTLGYDPLVSPLQVNLSAHNQTNVTVILDQRFHTWCSTGTSRPRSALPPASPPGGFFCVTGPSMVPAALAAARSRMHKAFNVGALLQNAKAHPLCDTSDKPSSWDR